MEAEHISKSLLDILESPEALAQRRESTLTLVQSLIQEGKIREAKALARDSMKYPWVREVCIAIEPLPETAPNCDNGHPVTWEFNYFTNGLSAWYLPPCERCERDRIVHERRPYRHRPQEELHAILHSIGVPTRYLNATVKRLESLTDSLFLTGLRGTGKTHMAAAMIREIMLDKRPEDGRASIRWVSAVDLLLEIRGSFKDGAERCEDSIIDEYSECRLLVLDDLGAEKTTEWSLQTLYTIIDRRYREERQTIITSNLSLDELAEKLDDRIASRLSELCRVVVLTGPDRRAQKKK